MKRMISYLLVITLLIFVMPIHTYAATNEILVMQFEDGSYMTDMLSIQEGRASGTKTGTRTRSYYASDNTLLWQVVLTGKFSYTGSSSSCTSSSVSANIYSSDWYTVSKSASKSGNTASANAVIGEKLLGVTVDKVNVSLTLSCNANGNLS